MTQVLLVINDKELSTILRGKLAQKYDVEVIVRNSAPEAISLFEILPDIEIILCSEFIDKVSAAGKICDYLNAKNEEDSREINIAVIGKSAPQNSKAVCIGENPSPQKIIDYLGFLLGKEEQNILEVEAKAEKEKAERERIEREKTQAEREKEEREREKEEREREKIEKELAEKERIAREIAFKERMAREQLERELAEKEKAEKKKAIEERIERGKARLEQIEKEKAEKEKADIIKAEKLRLANELAKELAEKERVARELAEREKHEKEIKEREKLEKLKLEREFAEKERIAKERAEKERLAKEREELLKEIANKEKNEKDRLEKERRQIENAEREKAAQERLERGNARKEKVEREKAEKEKAELEQKRIEQEKLEREKIEKEKALQERLEKAKSKIGHVEKESSESTEEDSGDNEKTTVFRLPVQAKKIETVQIQASEASNKNLVYSPINVIYFLNLYEELVDFSVYSRVKKGDGFDYIKKINANSKISITELERILIRCGKELYVSQEDFSKANAFLNGLFLDRFKDPNLNLVDRMLLNSESFEILLDLFKNSTFNKFNVEIIKELIKSMDLQVKAPEALKTFLLGLKSKKISYGYSHAHLTYFLLLKVVDHFPWSKDQSKNKLLYLALFHDLALNSDRLIKLHHNYSHEIKNLSEEEKEVLNVHADAAALVLESIVKAPVELTSLIREHHGFKSGKGHADSLSIAISPTSMAFIVIEDFVTQYLLALEKMEGDKGSGPSKPQLELIISELKKKYDRLTYSEVLVQIQKFIYTA